MRLIKIQDKKEMLYMKEEEKVYFADGNEISYNSPLYCYKLAGEEDNKIIFYKIEKGNQDNIDPWEE